MPDAVIIVEVPSLKRISPSRSFRFKYPDGRKYDQADWPIMRATRGQKVSDEECVDVLPDGSAMTVLISSAPVYDTEGQVVAAVAVARDVTEQDGADSASLRTGL